MSQSHGVEELCFVLAHFDMGHGRKFHPTQIDGAAIGADSSVSVTHKVEEQSVCSLFQFHSTERSFFHTVHIVGKCVVIGNQSIVDIQIHRSAARCAGCGRRVPDFVHVTLDRFVEHRHIQRIRTGLRCINGKCNFGCKVRIVKRIGEQAHTVIIGLRGIDEEAFTIIGLIEIGKIFINGPVCVLIQIGEHLRVSSSFRSCELIIDAVGTNDFDAVHIRITDVIPPRLLGRLFCKVHKVDLDGLQRIFFCRCGNRNHANEHDQHQQCTEQSLLHRLLLLSANFSII